MTKIRVAGMGNIFISYSRENRDRVALIAEALSSEGLNVWWDTEIPPGSTFADVIDKRLKEADCVLVIWSHASIQSNWVQEEADDGLQRGRLIPVMIDPVELPRGFKRVQTADLSHWKGERRDSEWLKVLSEVMRLAGDGQARRAQQRAAAAPQARQARPAAAASAPKKARPAPPPQAQKKKSGAPLIAALLLLGLPAAGAAYYFTQISPGKSEATVQTAKAPATDNVEQAAPTETPAAETISAETNSAPEPVTSETPVETLAETPAETLAATAPAASALPEPAFEAGAIFVDCENCPEVVVVAPGQIGIGAPDNERSSEKTETPVVNVTFERAFAMGRTEVTFEQWEACVVDGGCEAGSASKDMGWGKGKRPIINVTYNDAAAYADWLSAKTGETYRLPTEAEWEYAARAGSQAAFSFGDEISTRQANFNGDYPYGGGAKESSVGKTLPVASFKPNAFGLYDVHGNVWEWVSDCWKASHASLPADGSAIGGSCNDRVLKGGAWNGGAWRARSAHRKAGRASTGDFDTGFRVVREL